MKFRVLIYTQDVGGTKCWVSILKSWSVKFRDFQTYLICHSLSQSVLTQEEIKSDYHENLSQGNLISVDSWCERLKKSESEFVLTTLSSPYQDPTNVNLIVAARRLGIPTLGFMDHWKGYDRFYDEEGKAEYFPDFIGCIDEISFQEFMKRGVDPGRVAIVGHPALERLLDQSQDLPAPDFSDVLLVSQPQLANRSFSSVFQDLEALVGVIRHVLPTAALRLRRHPKERSSLSLPTDVRLDDSPSSLEALRKASVVIGLDSSVMLEANLMGRFGIILDFPELAAESAEKIPYEYGTRVHNISELITVMQRGLQQGLSVKSDTKLRSVLQGSGERALAFVAQCLQIRLNHLQGGLSCPR